MYKFKQFILRMSKQKEMSTSIDLIENYKYVCLFQQEDIILI